MSLYLQHLISCTWSSNYRKGKVFFCHLIIFTILFRSLLLSWSVQLYFKIHNTFQKTKIKKQKAKSKINYRRGKVFFVMLSYLSYYFVIHRYLNQYNCTLKYATFQKNQISKIKNSKIKINKKISPTKNLGENNAFSCYINPVNSLDHNFERPLEPFLYINTFMKIIH